MGIWSSKPVEVKPSFVGSIIKFDKLALVKSYYWENEDKAVDRDVLFFLRNTKYPFMQSIQSSDGYIKNFKINEGLNKLRITDRVTYTKNNATKATRIENEVVTIYNAINSYSICVIINKTIRDERGVAKPIPPNYILKIMPHKTNYQKNDEYKSTLFVPPTKIYNVNNPNYGKQQSEQQIIKQNNAKNEFKKKYETFLSKKNFCGNLLPNIYFVGSNISRSVDKELLDMSRYELPFEITKYYDKLENLNEDGRKVFLEKAIASIMFINNNNHFIVDLDPNNLKTDEGNFVLYDYGKHIFLKHTNKIKNEKLEVETITETDLTPNTDIGDFLCELFEHDLSIPCYMMKYLSEKLEPNMTITIYDIEVKEDDTFEKLQSFASKNFPNNELGFHNFNAFGLSKIILSLFFDPNDWNKLFGIEPIIKGGKTDVLPDQNVLKSNESVEKLPTTTAYVNKITKLVNEYGNLNNIKILTDFIKNANPISPDYEKICEHLKPLLFDVESETGLLAPEYSDIPPLELCFQYMTNLKTLPEIQMEYEKLLKENITPTPLEVQNFSLHHSTKFQTHDEWKKDRFSKKQNAEKEQDELRFSNIPPQNTNFEKYYTINEYDMPITTVGGKRYVLRQK